MTTNNMCVPQRKWEKKKKAKIWKKGGKRIWDLIWQQLIPTTLSLQESNASNSMRYSIALAREDCFYWRCWMITTNKNI